MKKLFSLTLFACYCLTGLSQELEYKDYNWENRSKVYTLSEKEEKESAVICKDLRAIEYIYAPDGHLQKYFTRHRIVHLNDDQALKDHNRIYLSVLNPEDLISLKARAISRDGKVTEIPRSNVKEIEEEGSKYLILAVEGLEKGGELEYFFTIREASDYYGKEYLQSATTTKKVELKIISPKNLFFDAKSYNNLPKPSRDTLSNAKNVIGAKIDSVPGLPSETYAAYRANLMRFEYKLSRNTNNGVSGIYAYADLGKNYYHLVHVNEKTDKKETDKLFDQLKLKKITSPEDRIRAIENYMKQNIALQKGLPNLSMKDIMKNHFSNELGCITIYVMMMDRCGIPCELVTTCDRMERSFDPDFESPDFLEVYLLYFPDYKKFLAPGDYAERYGSVASGYTNNKALFVKEVDIGDTKSGLTTIRSVDPVPYEKNFSNMDVTVSFPESMEKVKMHTIQSMGGYEASALRPFYFYAAADKKKDLAESILKSGADESVVENLVVKNYDLGSGDADKDFIMEADVFRSTLLEKASDSWIFKIGDVIGPQQELYQEKPRQCPVSLKYPHSYKRVITVNIPEGYKVKGAESLKMNVALDDQGTKTASFNSDYTVNGNTLTVTVTEFYRNYNYAVARFPDFQKVINAAADFNKISVVFSK